MENKKEQEMEQDDIINLEQFQVGRAPEEEKQPDDQDEAEYTEDDAEYTEDEVEFADGEGTQLDEELGDDVPDADDIDADDLDDDDLDDDDLPADESEEENV